VDPDLDKVRVFEGACHRLEFLVVEAPAQRPSLLELTAQPALVLFQRRSAAFQAEVPLIPVRSGLREKSC
jgi:hypothetical protein